MATFYDQLEDKHLDFIKEQKMFFVATAPEGADGHVNLSPKGYDAFKVIDRNTVAYLDLGGSGIETLAHVKENGRITFMFCAFGGKANIMRIYGRGEVVSFNEPGFEEKFALFEGFDRARSVFTVKVEKVQDSCGWGVPFYEFKGERDQLVRTNAHRSREEWETRRLETNQASIDGLPGLVRND